MATGIPGLMSNYGRMDVTFSHGRGAWLWDNEGRQYLDALCGIAVCGLGHRSEERRVGKECA